MRQLTSALCMGFLMTLGACGQQSADANQMTAANEALPIDTAMNVSSNASMPLEATPDGQATQGAGTPSVTASAPEVAPAPAVKNTPTAAPKVTPKAQAKESDTTAAPKAEAPAADPHAGHDMNHMSH